MYDTQGVAGLAESTLPPSDVLLFAYVYIYTLVYTVLFPLSEHPLHPLPPAAPPVNLTTLVIIYRQTTLLYYGTELCKRRGTVSI